MVFYVSDMYFGNTSVAYNRHFKDVNSMNNRIIENWNSVIDHSDKVYILGGVGDFGFLLSLNGEKTLMMSEHEIKTYSDYIHKVTTEVDDMYNKEMFESYVVSMMYATSITFSDSVIRKDYSGNHIRLTTKKPKLVPEDLTVFGGVSEYYRVCKYGVNSNIFVNGMYPISEVEVEDMRKHLNDFN